MMLAVDCEGVWGIFVRMLVLPVTELDVCALALGLLFAIDPDVCALALGNEPYYDI
jgi:hypothetical protein